MRHLDGSLDGRYYPLVFVAIAAVSALARPGASLVVIALALAFEALLRQVAYDSLSLSGFAPHVGFAAAALDPYHGRRALCAPPRFVVSGAR